MPITDPDIEEAVRQTTIAADLGSAEGRARTANPHRAAVLKRQSFIDQIAQIQWI